MYELCHVYHEVQKKVSYFAAIKNWPVPSASAQVSVKSLLHLCRCTLLTSAMRNSEGGVASNHHSRGAEATLRAMKASDALCTTIMRLQSGANQAQRVSCKLFRHDVPCTALKPV